jgi:hypothetical protein
MMGDRSCHEEEQNNSLFVEPAPLSSCALVDEDRDALREGLGWLGVKAAAKFERIATQPFASFPDDLVKLRQFTAQRLIAVFLAQARQKKMEIMFATQQFA